MIRSMLFVPGDSPRKFASAMRGSADALVLDLEDAVAPGRKAEARAATVEMLRSGGPGEKKLFVRVNALDTGLTLEDLAAVMPLSPYAIMLPKCSGGADVARLALYLDAFEAASRQGSVAHASWPSPPRLRPRSSAWAATPPSRPGCGD